MKAAPAIAKFIDSTISVVSQTPEDSTIATGLFEGKAGHIIAYSVLYNYTGNAYWQQEGARLVDDICTALCGMGEMGYAEGFTGVGWCIEWLAQKGFVKANTDEILEDFDDNIYKLVMFAVDNNISLNNGVLGKSAYFLKRLQAANFNTHRFKTICHHECLVLLTDELQQHMQDIMADVTENGFNNLQNLLHIADAIIFLAKFTIHRINTECAENTLYQLVEFTDNLLTNNNMPAGDELPTHVYKVLVKLSYACYYAGYKTGCKQWASNGLAQLSAFMRLWRRNIPVEDRLDAFPILARLFHGTGDEQYLDIFLEDASALRLESMESRLNKGLFTVLLPAVSLLKKETIDWDEALLYS